LEQVPANVIVGEMAASGESPIYRDLMRFKPAELSLNAWAVQAGVSRTVWTDMRRHGNPSRRTLEKLLEAAGSSLAEFEALRLGEHPRSAVGSRALADPRRDWRAPTLAPLPLVASSFGGEWDRPGSGIDLTELRSGEVLERLPRPPSLGSDPDAFALVVVGDSMWPRFGPGSRIAASPRATVAVGDDVLVRLRTGDGIPNRTLIKRLAKQDAVSVELRQFNPDCAFCVDREEIDAVIKVLGELI
jgi:hypothetical protein